MYFVGRIRKEIYQCITSDCITDEVIITDKQVEHIKQRHPNDYERYGKPERRRRAVRLPDSSFILMR